MDSTTVEQRPYSKAEAAELLGVSERTLVRYARDGKIAIVRHGGQSWVTADAIRDYWSRLDRAADQRRVAAEKRTRRR